MYCPGNREKAVTAYAETEIASPADAEGEPQSNIYTGDNYEVRFVLDSVWQDGCNATITITNTGNAPIENWCMAFPLGQEITNIWNAVKEEAYEDYYIIKNAGWNQDIPVGGSVSFGITANDAFTDYPSYYTMIGNEIEVKTGDYVVDYVITDDWGVGYKAEITITNNKAVPLEDWRLQFEYGDNLITKIWNAVITAEENGCYEIGCESYNQNILPGQSVTIGIMVEPGCSETDIKNLTLKEHRTETAGSFAALTGYIEEGTRKLALYMESSEECYRYEIYASRDGGEYTKIVEVENDKEYLYTLSADFGSMDIYAEGYYGAGARIQSTHVTVSLTDGIYTVTMPDTDGDGLEDCFELYYGSDLTLKDSDGDGLTDGYEVYTSFTNPVKADTDENGINDGDEDTDKDGLTNKEECAAAANPRDDDTDMDGLKDGEEIKAYGTDPLNPDTDEDGLKDGDETDLKTDPLNPDTDGDGIPDGKEKYAQTYTHHVENEECAIREITVALEGTGNLQNNTSIESIMDKDVLCTDVAGLVGEPFAIETESDFEEAKLIFMLDKDKLGDIPFENLMFLWYDEEHHSFVELDTTLDEEQGTASITTTHFSKYMLVNSADWFAAWAEEIDYNPNGGKKPAAYNTVLAIDCSGSMSTNDPITTKQNITSLQDATYRKQCNRINGAETFINRMTGDDRAAVVLFTSRAELSVPLTDDRQSLKLALQNIKSSGNTSFNAALTKSMQAFDEEMLADKNVCNRIILLSDGQSGYSQAILKEIADKGITIYTIGLGSGADKKTLTELSEYTSGKAFQADTSDELAELYERIYTDSDFDKTDKDNDGIYDIIETAGIRLPNGRVIYTDSNSADTDGDGLSDGEEIEPKPVYYKKEVKICGQVIFVQGYSFVMRSDPTSADSDGDGAIDGEDATPVSYNERMSYIFYPSHGESYLHNEANVRYKSMKNIYGRNAEKVETTTIGDFRNEWNDMGLDAGGKKAYIIDEVCLVYHGGPRYVCIGENEGWLYADFSEKGKAYHSVYNRRGRDITIAALKTKSINYLNLSSCNNGNLDFMSSYGIEGIEDNLAIAFLNSKHNIGKITAWDGYSTFDGVYIDFWLGKTVIAFETAHGGDKFSVWSSVVNGNDRKAEGQITYWKDANGNICYKPSKGK